MKSSHAIHWILVWVLCLGQVVANAHVIGHIGADDNQANHPSTHTGEHFHEHHGTLLSLEEFSSDNDKSDCAVYHAYAGSAAITPAVCNAVAIGPRRTLEISYHHSNLYTGLADTQPIRGPPTHS